MKIKIIGAGIAGLTAAWYLQKIGKVTLYEKSSRVGGWIETIHQDGFCFERGPRGFRPMSHGKQTLSLCKALGLDLIAANGAAKTRFICRNGKLEPFSPKSLIGGLVRDLFATRPKKDDETIEEFFGRHIGKKLTAAYLDPLARGIFGGDYKKLSARSCFPSLWTKRSFVLMKKEKAPAALYSFRGGMEALPKAIAERLDAEIRLDEGIYPNNLNSRNFGCVKAPGLIDRKQPHISNIGSVTIDQSRELSRQPKSDFSSCLGIDKAEADVVIWAIPQALECATLSTVSLGWHHEELAQMGYGFLVPSSEPEPFYGMTWDSMIFPQQEGKTRVCVMIPGAASDEELLSIANRAVKKYTGIEAPADSVFIGRAINAIPQYYLGHHKWVEAVESKLPANHYVIGSSFRGVGVNECVADAHRIASLLGAV